MLFVLQLSCLKEEYIEMFFAIFGHHFSVPHDFLSLINLILFSQHRSIFTQGWGGWFLVSWSPQSANMNWYILQASVVFHSFNKWGAFVVYVLRLCLWACIFDTIFVSINHIGLFILLDWLWTTKWYSIVRKEKHHNTEVSFFVFFIFIKTVNKPVE